jgi:hypothetical protein
MRCVLALEEREARWRLDARDAQLERAMGPVSVTQIERRQALESEEERRREREDYDLLMSSENQLHDRETSVDFAATFPLLLGAGEEDPYELRPSRRGAKPPPASKTLRSLAPEARTEAYHTSSENLDKATRDVWDLSEMEDELHVIGDGSVQTTKRKRRRIRRRHPASRGPTYQEPSPAVSPHSESDPRFWSELFVPNLVSDANNRKIVLFRFIFILTLQPPLQFRRDINPPSSAGRLRSSSPP